MEAKIIKISILVNTGELVDFLVLLDWVKL